MAMTKCKVFVPRHGRKSKRSCNAMEKAEETKTRQEGKKISRE